jgi:hypothetical protein
MNSMPWPTMAASAEQEHPFSRALDGFLGEMKKEEDKKSLFYQEVLSAKNAIIASNGPAQCHKSAEELTNFIASLEQKLRKESKLYWITTKLEPFVESLSKIMGLCAGLVQSAPLEVHIAFSGARLLLQVGLIVGNSCSHES